MSAPRSTNVDKIKKLAQTLAEHEEKCSEQTEETTQQQIEIFKRLLSEIGDIPAYFKNPSSLISKNSKYKAALAPLLLTEIKRTETNDSVLTKEIYLGFINLCKADPAVEDWANVGKCLYQEFLKKELDKAKFNNHSKSVEELRILNAQYRQLGFGKKAFEKKALLTQIITLSSKIDLSTFTKKETNQFNLVSTLIEGELLYFLLDTAQVSGAKTNLSKVLAACSGVILNELNETDSFDLANMCLTIANKYTSLNNHILFTGIDTKDRALQFYILALDILHTQNPFASNFFSLIHAVYFNLLDHLIREHGSHIVYRFITEVVREYTFNRKYFLSEIITELTLIMNEMTAIKFINESSEKTELDSENHHSEFFRIFLINAVDILKLDTKVVKESEEEMEVARMCQGSIAMTLSVLPTLVKNDFHRVLALFNVTQEQYLKSRKTDLETSSPTTRDINVQANFDKYEVLFEVKKAKALIEGNKDACDNENYSNLVMQVKTELQSINIAEYDREIQVRHHFLLLQLYSLHIFSAYIAGQEEKALNSAMESSTLESYLEPGKFPREYAKYAIQYYETILNFYESQKNGLNPYISYRKKLIKLQEWVSEVDFNHKYYSSSSLIDDYYRLFLLYLQANDIQTFVEEANLLLYRTPEIFCEKIVIIEENKKIPLGDAIITSLVKLIQMKLSDLQQLNTKDGRHLLRTLCDICTRQRSLSHLLPTIAKLLSDTRITINSKKSITATAIPVASKNNIFLLQNYLQAHPDTDAAKIAVLEDYLLSVGIENEDKTFSINTKMVCSQAKKSPIRQAPKTFILEEEQITIILKNNLINQGAYQLLKQKYAPIVIEQPQIIHTTAPIINNLNIKSIPETITTPSITTGKKSKPSKSASTTLNSKEAIQQKLQEKKSKQLELKQQQEDARKKAELESVAHKKAFEEKQKQDRIERQKLQESKAAESKIIATSTSKIEVALFAAPKPNAVTVYRKECLSQALTNVISLQILMTLKNGDIEDKVRHYALLYNIFNCFKSLKYYKESGASTTVNLDHESLTDIRNMLIHGGAHIADEKQVTETANDLIKKLPHNLLELKKKGIHKLALNESQRKELVSAMGLGDESYKREEYALIIDQTSLYKQLEVFHASKFSNDEDKKLLQSIIVDKYIPLMKEIIDLIKINSKNISSFRSFYTANPDEFQDSYFFQVQALRMVMTICGELSHYFKNIHFKEYPTLMQTCRHVRNDVGHYSIDHLLDFEFFAMAYNALHPVLNSTKANRNAMYSSQTNVSHSFTTIPSNNLNNINSKP